jgi:sigma-B regulation protein RsbQ
MDGKVRVTVAGDVREVRVSVVQRHNVMEKGAGTRPIVFAHGFGCDQNMWRFVAPAFEAEYRVILFDHVGAGGADRSAFDPIRYSSLDGYADDVVQLCRALEVTGGVFVGHSVSAMIGVLALKEAPELFDELVLIGPSPRYIDDRDYVDIAKRFARTTFLADNRADLPDVTARCLVLQCAEDVIAPPAVGEYVHRHLPNSELVLMKATGHCPNLSAPEETIEAMKVFLAGERRAA